MKYVIASSLNAMEDMMPKAVIFSVDFFHAVYLATCVQRTRSTVTVAIIIAVDVMQSASVLYGLHRRSRTMLARARRTDGVSSEKWGSKTSAGFVYALASLTNYPKRAWNG
ncbi:hypothetical protein GQ600_268 [Phytophthora cactorum]|nr:hypothetical protein GQ600_268 [Phytophthora cactorum]